VDSPIPRRGRLPGENSQEVVSVAGTVNSSQGQNIQRHNILNSDGQPHPVQNALTLFTLVVGLVSFALGMIVRNAHTSAAVIVITTATGLLACLVGLYVQMVSSTREQRILIVTGIIAGFVGLAIALGHGGFTA
jgi:ammonia channel protein AmtB